MSELGWTMDVQDMPHTSGLKYPVFHWAWGEIQEGGLKGIDLHAWITMGGITYKERREDEDIPLEALETAREYLVEKMGLPEPPFLEAVFADVRQFHNEQLPHFGSREEAEQACQNLKEKWQKLFDGDTQ